MGVANSLGRNIAQGFVQSFAFGVIWAGARH